MSDEKPPEPDFLDPFEDELEPSPEPETRAPDPPASSPEVSAAPVETPPDAAPPAAVSEPEPAPSTAAARAKAARGPRPVLVESREPLYREEKGFRLRLEPPDLARLRELPGSKGKSDRELGEEFFEQLASRFAESLAEDVTPPAEVRVVVDPYSRQAFLAIERTIRSILSF